MRYVAEDEKAKKHEAKKDLINLYLGSSSIHEFLVNQELYLPEASSNDVKACKICFWKKEHPIAWECILVGFRAMLLGSIALHLLVNSWWLFAFSFGMLVGALCYTYAFGGFIRQIEWHEARCPIDHLDY